MGGWEIVVRILLQVAITAALIIGYMMKIGDTAGLVLIVPFFFGIPGVLIVLLIFIPTEIVTIKTAGRWLGLLLHPLVGAGIPWLLYPMAGNPQNFFAGIWMVSALGCAWGLLWSATWVVYEVFAFMGRKNTTSESS